MERRESALCRRLTTHLRRYPQMAVQDLYKLIFQAAMAAQAFPAVHHSERYRQAYRPAYRVIVRGFLTDHSAQW